VGQKAISSFHGPKRDGPKGDGLNCVILENTGDENTGTDGTYSRLVIQLAEGAPLPR
jgi:hypothetical protein